VALVTSVRPLALVGIFCVAAPTALLASGYEPASSAVSFAYSRSHAVRPLPDSVIQRTLDTGGIPFAYDDGDNFEHPPDKPADPRLGPPRALSKSGVCATIASVALTYRLPVAFFANLIWQESGFNPRDISHAGAQGIAQFMPKTAVDYGLINPFEPIHALNVAARFLRELRGQFGNLGLAAAAYNAGPRRVIDWMGKRGGLPGETRSYVLRITGQTADRWTDAGVALDPEMTLMPAKAPCIEVKEAVAQQAQTVRVTRLIMELAAATAPPPEPKVAAAKPVETRKNARATAERRHGSTKVADKGVPGGAKAKSKDRLAKADKPARKLASSKSGHPAARHRDTRRTRVASSR
jgi:hypothetical protein